MVSTPSMAKRPTHAVHQRGSQRRDQPQRGDEEAPVHGDLDRDIAYGSGTLCETDHAPSDDPAEKLDQQVLR